MDPDGPSGGAQRAQESKSAKSARERMSGMAGSASNRGATCKSTGTAGLPSASAEGGMSAREGEVYEGKDDEDPMVYSNRPRAEARRAYHRQF